MTKSNFQKVHDRLTRLSDDMRRSFKGSDIGGCFLTIGIRALQRDISNAEVALRLRGLADRLNGEMK